MKTYFNNHTIRKCSFCIIAVLLVVLLPMCTNNTDFSNKLYITQAKFSPYAHVTLSDGKGDFKLNVSSVYKMEEDIKITLAPLDSVFMESYNKAKHTEYQVVPLEAVSFSTKEVNISSKAAFSNDATIKIKKWEGYKEGVDYALPVKISSASNGMPVVDGSDFIILELSEVVISNAATSAGYAGVNFSPAKPGTVFGETLLNKPYGKITIEGKIMYTKTFLVPGNWRSDIFVGFGLQILAWENGTLDIRFPDAKFIGPFGKLTLNQWHHFAVTNDNGVISCYVDGDLKMASSYTGEMTASSFTIGGYADGCGLAVDEFRIWKSVRTAKQIKKYPCIVDPKHPDLLAYYRFNESEGKTSKDETLKGNDLKTESSIKWISGVSCP